MTADRSPRVPTPGRRVGAILAGGQSRRMGRAKAGIRLPNGETLAERAAAALWPHVDEVVVLGHGEGAPEPLRRIQDPPGTSGPVAGLLALLRSEAATDYVVVPCDMPALEPALIGRLLDARGQSTCAFWCAPAGDEAQPMAFPFVCGRALLPALEGYVARGGRRWMALLGIIDATRVPIAAEERPLFVNANRPTDLPAGAR